MSRTYRISEEALARRAARMKALHADPAFKASTSARMKALHADPAFKASTSARMKALHADPAFKASTSARMKALNADPAFKAKMKALHADPAFKAKMRRAADKRIQGFSVRQLKIYFKLRDSGVDEKQALREASSGARSA